MARYLNPECVFQALFHAPAVAALADLHSELGGRLRYVISSSWREHFTRAQLRYVFREAGLGIVADGLEGIDRWATPVLPRPDRHSEVARWLEQYHQREPFAVIDDMWSGSSLWKSRSDPVRVALCEPTIGLQAQHLDKLSSALRTPLGILETW